MERKDDKEVKKFNKYLGYTLQRNGGEETHVKERTRRAASNGSNMGYREEMVWEGSGRRLWLFDRLVWTVMGYGVEIWDWKERSMKKLGDI